MKGEMKLLKNYEVLPTNQRFRRRKWAFLSEGIRSSREVLILFKAFVFDASMKSQKSF